MAVSHPADRPVAITILLHKASPADLARLSRNDRRLALVRRHTRLREEILAFLKEFQFGDQIRLEPATTFAMLLGEATPDVIQRLREAPGVIDVLTGTTDLPIDLLIQR